MPHLVPYFSKEPFGRLTVGSRHAVHDRKQDFRRIWFSGWDKARGRLKNDFQTASGCLVKSGLSCQPQPPHLPQPLLQSCFFDLNKNFRKRKNKQASMMMPTIIY